MPPDITLKCSAHLSSTDLALMKSVCEKHLKDLMAIIRNQNFGALAQKDFESDLNLTRHIIDTVEKIQKKRGF